MDRFDDDTLVAELRELRPEPTAEFTAELDEWAAAGFPRRSTASASRFERLGRRLRSISFGQLMIPAAGTAIALIAVAIVVIAVAGGGGSGSSALRTTSSESVSGGAVEAEETAGGEEAGEEAEATAEPPSAGTAKGKFNGGFFDESGKKAGGNAAGGRAAPAEAEGTEHAGEESVEGPIEEEATEEKAESEGPVEEEPFVAPAPPVSHRDVERGTSMILGTKPGEVAGASRKVFEAVSAAKGYVLHSSVQSGTRGSTAATFSMLIPNRNLNDALAAFSQIGEVRQRHDATNDITAPTVSATEELRDSNASIEGLLKELGNAETEEERESVEARLREERRRHAGIRASLEHLHKRASLAEVSLRIVTPRGADAAPASKGSDSGWSVGDALHDAGHILTVAAGVLLIALAVLAPIALILLLIWLANRFRVRRLRERALG